MPNFPEPIGKRRHNSVSSGLPADSNGNGNHYHRAPGSEREDAQVR